MKSTLITFSFLLLSFLSIAQTTAIPDSNFEQALIDLGIDNLLDGQISNIDAQNVNTLNLRQKNIADLTGIEAFSNLYELICDGNELTSLDLSQNNFLFTLECSSNQLTSLDLTPNNDFNYLSCGGNQLTSLDLSQNPYLGYIWCSGNQLTYLDVSQCILLETLNIDYNLISNIDLSQNAELQTLSCKENLFNFIDVSLCPNLSIFDCANNQLANLDVTQNSNLTILECNANQLSNLDISNCPLLETLNCRENQISNLDVSNNLELTDLVCLYNNISNLDVSQNIKLGNLRCAYNQLSSLDVSANTLLWRLIFSHNFISEIDLSQNIELQTLYTAANNLTSLNLEHNPKLEVLITRENQITSLDLSNQPLLNVFACDDNQLTTLILKNGNSSHGLNFEGNPNLEYICGDAEEIAAINDKLVEFNITNCVANSFCSFTPGGDFYTIEGNCSYDLNNDGCGTGDQPVPYLRFDLTDGTTDGDFISNLSGDYSIPIQAGNYTVTNQIENPDYFNVSPSNFMVDFPATATPFVQDFCITPNGIHNDLEIVLFDLNRARPGFDAEYKIIYKNKGTTELSGSVTLDFDAQIMELITANPNIDNQNNNTLTWGYNNLLPFESRTITFTMNLNSPMDTPPLTGDENLTFNASVNPIAGDETEENNTFSLDQEVVNSFDPNDITCLQGDSITINQVGKYIHYKIRFENLGTAEAVNIVVKDIIDTTKLDVNSLVPLDASHNFVTRITNTNQVEFIFENINLPFDTLSNKGYVLFKIKTLPFLVVGDFFENQADIYFDFNHPITTNIAITFITEEPTVSTRDLKNNASINVFPNPTQGFITIKSQNLPKTDLDISILNIQGMEMFHQTFPYTKNFERNIDLTSFSPGIYFLKVNNNVIRLVR